jgi:hypothetical protein
MSTIGIEYDAKQGHFVMRTPPGLHLMEHNGDMLNYEQALRLRATLGEMLKLHTQNSDHQRNSLLRDLN